MTVLSRPLFLCPPVVLPRRYLSEPAGLQEDVHTVKDDSARNYHFWCEDKDGNIIDKTPTTMPDLNDKPVYIAWGKEEATKQMRYCERITLKTEFPYRAAKDVLKMIYDEEAWEEKKCFRNSWAFSMYNKDYHMVCGSFGFILDPEHVGYDDDYEVVGLDYGY